jgi:hypothetical protein
MKRFTETQKWDDPWFRQLAGVHKLVFLYIIDRCDNAGFLEIDQDAMAWHTKVKSEHIEGALKGLERGIKGPCDGWYWVRRFLKHQKNETLNPDNPAHKQIISLIGEQRERFASVPEFQSFVGPIKGLLSPIGIGTGLVKVKGRVKRGAFVKPSRDEAKCYGEEISMPSADVDSWYDHFESNGWRVGGKSPMLDWKAAMRNGKRGHSRNGNHPAKSEEPAPPGYRRGDNGKLWKDMDSPHWKTHE